MLPLVESPPKGAETIESSKEPHNPIRQMHRSRFVRLDDWFLCSLAIIPADKKAAPPFDICLGVAIYAD